MLLDKFCEFLFWNGYWMATSNVIWFDILFISVFLLLLLFGGWKWRIAVLLMAVITFAALNYGLPAICDLLRGLSAFISGFNLPI